MYWAWPGRHLRMLRASTPERNRSESFPVMRYLYRGEVSNTPAAFRMAKYSNFSDIWYLSTTRYPAQWLHSPVCVGRLDAGVEGGGQVQRSPPGRGAASLEAPTAGDAGGYASPAMSEPHRAIATVWWAMVSTKTG